MTGRCLLSAILLALAACAANDPPAPPEPAETIVAPVVQNSATASETGLEALEAPGVPLTTMMVPADENRLICRRERTLGSNIPRRVCRTQRQIDAEKAAGQESLRVLSNRTLNGDLQGAGTE
jgi:hypothetical protein